MTAQNENMMADIFQMYRQRSDKFAVYPLEPVDNCNRIITVTIWETLDSETFQITRNVNLRQFKNYLWRQFPNLPLAFELYYLPENELWDLSRILIKTNDQLANLAFSGTNVQLFAYGTGGNGRRHSLKTLPFSIKSYFSTSKAIPTAVAAHDNQVVPYNDGMYDEEQQTLERHCQLTLSARTGRVPSKPTHLSKELDEFQDEVFLRDSDVCVFCSRGDSLRAAVLLSQADIHLLHKKQQQQQTYEIAAGSVEMPPSIHNVRNGITLCCDCYTLFSVNLVGIRPGDLTLVASPVLLASPRHMAQWRVLHGQQVRVPFNEDWYTCWPPTSVLQCRYLKFVRDSNGFVPCCITVLQRWSLYCRRFRRYCKVLCSEPSSEKKVQTSAISRFEMSCSSDPPEDV